MEQCCWSRSAKTKACDPVQVVLAGVENGSADSFILPRAWFAKTSFVGRPFVRLLKPSP